MTLTKSRYEIEGRSVPTPVGVRRAFGATAVFTVPADAARGWLPAGLRLVEPLPGRALLSLAAVRYLDNDLGSYSELSIAVMAMEAGRRAFVPDALSVLMGGAGTYIHRLPVDEVFSCAAGRGIWGFPKTVEDLTVDRSGDAVVCEWEAAGALVLRLVIRGTGSRSMSARPLTAYSLIDGALHETRFLMRATDVGMRRGGVELELGRGEVAAELRALGLPKQAQLATTMGHLQAAFDAPRPTRAAAQPMSTASSAMAPNSSPR